MALAARDDEVRPSWRVPLERYHALIELGAFRDEDHLELVDGHITPLSPKTRQHENAISFLVRRLVQALPDDFEVRAAAPLTLVAEQSEPEPDVAVIAPGTARPYHPATAALVIEVAHSSLRYDRTVKRRLYARAAIPELWIVDLAGRSVERCNEPVDDGYAVVETLDATALLMPELLPRASIPVADLFAAAFRQG